MSMPYHPKIDMHVLPGGIVPERQTKEAIGYDVHIRAIVSPRDMDPDFPHLRLTLFNFKEMPLDPTVLAHVVEVPGGDPERRQDIAYRLDPGESVLCGIGFITAMPYPMFYWVTPRSGLAAKHGIQVTNAPGTVDSDYRGEAGVLVLNRGTEPFLLRHGMRIAQIVFQWALMPEFDMKNSYEELAGTSRGAGGFGSTGLEIVSVEFPDKEWCAEVVANSDWQAIEAIVNDPRTPGDPLKLTVVERVPLGSVIQWIPNKRQP